LIAIEFVSAILIIEKIKERIMNYATEIQKKLYRIGGSDRRISLFEAAYPVPEGMSYNAYVFVGEKTVLFDTADVSVSDEFLTGLQEVLNGRELDYLVTQHIEPDHSALFRAVTEAYPSAVVLATNKAAVMLQNYYGFPAERVKAVSDGETIDFGGDTFTFLTAPLVHWPEVMMTYWAEGETLFSADAFGVFGARGGETVESGEAFTKEYLSEARRYYTNIVGKYGVQTRAALKKTEGKNIQTICSLHGPVWKGDLAGLIEKYTLWSGYLPEENTVAVFYASVYGHMKQAAELLHKFLLEEGVKGVTLYDVSTADVSYLVSESFRASALAFCSVTYNAGAFVKMENFLADLKAHMLQNRKYAIMESGSWAPSAARAMEETLSQMKNFGKVGENVKFLSAVKEEDISRIRELAHELALAVKA